MERAPPPSLAAAALAALDEELMDTPLSPKRPHQVEPATQVGTGATIPHPRITANSVHEPDMLTAMLQLKLHSTPHSHTQHNSEAGRFTREGLRALPLHSR
eukprot:scaffold123282_cov33-Tisochrysis_lutea.AAC.1